jgi:hypothetical protein
MYTWVVCVCNLSGSRETEADGSGQHSLCSNASTIRSFFCLQIRHPGHDHWLNSYLTTLQGLPQPVGGHLGG